MEVIEETVRYIEELQNRLIDSIGEEEAQQKMAETACFTLNNIVPDQDENRPHTQTFRLHTPALSLSRDRVSLIEEDHPSAIETRRRPSLNSNLRQ